LRHVPRLVVWSFGARERYLTGQPDHQLAGIDEPRVTHESRMNV
jgi:hypothetical protein